MRKIFYFLLPIFILIGCAQNMQQRLDNVRQGFFANDFVDAAQEFSGGTDFGAMDNLELLISSDALFHSNDFTASDAGYEEFNHRNIDLTGGSLGREATALIAGNMANEYRPYMMDSLFVSYYQLWAALAQSRFDDARVIINQSYARQQNMSREYADLIEESQQSYAENPDLVTQIQNSNSNWLAFRNIMNPALTYLAGIYFLNMGDFSDATTYLKRADGMSPGNSFIKQDLQSAEQGKIPSNVVWVFIEDSFAPKLQEERINVPMVTGNGISIVPIAISEPVFFDSVVSIDGAQELANVDALFMTEYGQYRINEALRAWASATTRAVLQSAMYNSNSQYAPFMGLSSTLFSVATTNAEVRTWATLPKNIYLLRTQKNKSGLIELHSNGNLIAEIPVPDGNVLVYIRFGNNAYDTKVIKIK